MGETNRQYPVFEAALSCEDCAPHTNGIHERKLAGDIIGIRRPALGIGSAERSRYIWLRLEGLEENEMWLLTELIPEFDKRRFAIPFTRLRQAYPDFDISRAMNRDEIYQPFLNVDHNPPYYFLNEVPAFDVHGLVWDKVRGQFL